MFRLIIHGLHHYKLRTLRWEDSPKAMLLKYLSIAFAGINEARGKQWLCCLCLAMNMDPVAFGIILST